MNKPAISVVIPAYNEEKFLPKLLTSLQKQTFHLPYEVIVVDNNSTDKTVRIAKKFGVKVVTAQKQGYAHACNAGFEMAQAEIIARADADYIVPPTWLESIWKAFHEDPRRIAVGGPLYPLESYWWENYISYPATVAWMYLLKWAGRGFLFPNIAMKKKYYYQVHGFNTEISFGEDQDMCLRLKDLGIVDLVLDVYVHTSMRRAKDLGMFKFIVGYSFANQLDLWLGKQPKYGLTIARVAPTKPAIPQKPWIYLIGTPVTLVLIILASVAIFYPPLQHSFSTFFQQVIK